MSRVAASIINERVVDEERCCYVCIRRKLSGALTLSCGSDWRLMSLIHMDSAGGYV